MHDATDRKHTRTVNWITYLGSFLLAACFASTFYGLVAYGTITTVGAPPAPPLLQSTAFGPVAIWSHTNPAASYTQSAAFRVKVAQLGNQSGIFSPQALANILLPPRPSPLASTRRATRAPSPLASPQSA
jgi:hypothetical protein